ncbi:hypothetical protein TNCV_2257381 [Trichonephila clavipes]|nr:hypothetical protein TNCV_2257381 [Trichonephila clavipes]
MALENQPNFKDICDGTFPDPVHEGVHEKEDISCCTMLNSYQFATYLQQFNKLHAGWSYKVTRFLPMPTCFTMVASLFLSNCPLPAYRRIKRSKSDLYHGGPFESPHDCQRQPSQRYINERLSLKSHLPESVPLEYLDFRVRGKFCHLAQGNSCLIVVKGSDQRKNFEKLGLFTINLEILPHFQDLNDRTLPDHLHDEVHEDYDISECTMVKSYRFARYLQHFNKLQAECKRQTAHLVE